MIGMARRSACSRVVARRIRYSAFVGYTIQYNCNQDLRYYQYSALCCVNIMIWMVAYEVEKGVE